METTAIIVTPCTTAGKGAKPALKSVRYWPLGEFIDWAKKSINVVRILKSSLPQEGDLLWRQKAEEKLIKSGLTLDSILDKLLIAEAAMNVQDK